jgi:hypothetical protein
MSYTRKVPFMYVPTEDGSGYEVYEVLGRTERGAPTPGERLGTATFAPDLDADGQPRPRPHGEWICYDPEGERVASVRNRLDGAYALRGHLEIKTCPTS